MYVCLYPRVEYCMWYQPITVLYWERFVCACMHASVHACVCMCVYMHVHVCVYIDVFACVCVHACACVCVCIHACAYCKSMLVHVNVSQF